MLHTGSRSTLLVLAAAIAPATPLLGQCALLFAEPLISPAPAPTAFGRLAVADFNSDGRSDVAYATDQSIVVFIAAAGGAFPASVTFNTTIGGVQVVPLALNADGHIDLAVCGYLSGGLSLHLNAATDPVSFVPAPTPSIGGVNIAIAAGDVTGDGFTDLVVARHDGSIRVLPGSASPGVFSIGTSYSGSLLTEVHDLALGDFNGDGRADIAIISNNVLRLFHGNEQGGFGTVPFNTPVSLSIASGARGLASGDFNGDGRADLVIASQSLTSLAVYLGQAGQSFAAPVHYGLAASPSDAAVADLDADGHLDLAATCPQAGTVIVRRGTGLGTFTELQTFAAGTMPSKIAVGDADGDGLADLIVTTDDGLAVLRQAETVPTITSQPVSQVVHASDEVTFSVAVQTGVHRPAFQWRRNGQVISPSQDGVSGANLPTLTIDSVTGDWSGSVFQCFITTACGEAISTPVSLVVHPACSADFNLDGSLDPDDLGDFINAYFSGCP